MSRKICLTHCVRVAKLAAILGCSLGVFRCSWFQAPSRCSRHFGKKEVLMCRSLMAAAALAAVFFMSSCQENPAPNPTPAPAPNPTPPPPPPRPNLIDSKQRWAGNPNPSPNQSCGQRTEHYLNAVCGYTSSTQAPPDSTCSDMAKVYGASQSDTVCGLETCTPPKKCKVNHVILGTPSLKYEDIPPGACPPQTAGWSCRIDITYDGLCQ